MIVLCTSVQAQPDQEKTNIYPTTCKKQDRFALMLTIYIVLNVLLLLLMIKYYFVIMLFIIIINFFLFNFNNTKIKLSFAKR